MEHKEKQTKEVEVIIDITCDCCGKSCSTSIEGQFEYMKMYSDWGYESNKDLEKWVAHICEVCVDEKFQFVNFKKINNINGKPLRNDNERKL